MVLVYGTLCLDRVRSIEKFPRPGGYAEILEERLLLGGESANTANALHAWGVPVALAGNAIGAGPMADVLIARLSEKGLPTEGLILEGETPICEVYVSSDGNRTMFGWGFCSMGDLARPEEAPYRPGNWFTADPNPGEASRKAARLAQEAGMRLYLMDFVQETDAIPEGCFWQSSTDWAGHRHEPERNLEWVRRWIDRNRAFCLLSDGRHGLIAGSPELVPRLYPPFPIEKVVDSTGAGDMLRAGMLLGLSQGWPIGECLAFGSAAGALKCRHLGATTGVPSLEEVRRHQAAHPDVRIQYHPTRL